MVTDKILYGGGIALRQIELDDCKEPYVKWLNDPEVNQYLETRWAVQTIESVMDFVRQQRENDHSILFAITLVSGGRHIGNIKIGPVDPHYRHADISYFIGDKELWNRGIATNAVNLVSGFGFDSLNLHRVEAGVYAGAVGSWRALEKNGFTREAVFRGQGISNGVYMDIYRYGLLSSEYKAIQYMEV